MRILVAEDDPVLVASLVELLEEEGHEVQAFADGRSLLLALLHRAPDLVLLDLLLPVFDGRRVVAYLHQRQDLQQVPIVVMTALLLDAAERQALRQLCPQIRSILAKPFTLQDLLRAMVGLR